MPLISEKEALSHLEKLVGMAASLETLTLEGRNEVEDMHDALVEYVRAVAPPSTSRLRPWSERRRRQYLSMVAEGASRSEIARTFGLTVWGLDSRVRAEGLAGKMKPSIDWDKIGQHILTAHDAGTSVYQLSRQFGISEPALTNWLRKKGRDTSRRVSRRRKDVS